MGYGMCVADGIVQRGHRPKLVVTAEDLAGGDPARGKRWVHGVARCSECHALDLGGKVVVDSGLGRVVAPNITPGDGSATQAYEPLDWVRAIRHGVSPDGRGLWLMPAARLRRIARAELADMVAYLQAARPVARRLEPSSLGVFGKTLLGYGKLPLIAAETLPPAAPLPSAPPRGATAAFGAYVLSVAGCQDCHGADLQGGAMGPDERAPGLSRAAAWSDAQWATLLRSGERPDGSRVDDNLMPIRDYVTLGDEEIGALAAHIRASANAK